MEGDLPCSLSSENRHLYIHDIASTLIPNKQIIKYVSDNNIDLDKIPLTIRDFLIHNSDRKIEVVVLQAYDYENGEVMQDCKHLITLIGQTYSHYVEDPNGQYEMSKCGIDEYDFETHEMKKRIYRRENSFSEQDSSKRVLDLYQQGEHVCGNSHKFVNEFCYDLYNAFLDKRDFKGRLLKQPEGFSFPFIARSKFITSETVVFGNNTALEIVDDSNISYNYEHKTLSFDIETLLVDERGQRMQDKIIQVSLVYQEGGYLKRCIGITVGNVTTDKNFYNYDNVAPYFENQELPVAEIFVVRDERQLIEKFEEIVYDTKPDYLAGYNISGFDIQILIKCADKYNIDLIEDLSHFKGFETNKYYIKCALSAFKHSNKSTKGHTNLSLLDNNSSFEINCHLFPGMLINDLYRCHKGERLDEIAIAKLGIGKEDVSYSEIPTLFYSDDKLDRSRLMKYNIVDSLLVAALLNTSDNFGSYKFFVTSSYTAKVPHSEFFNQQKTPLLTPMFYYAFRKKNILQEMKIKPLKESNKVCITEIIQLYLYHKESSSYWLTSELIEKINSGEIKTKTINRHFDFHSEYGNVKCIDFDTAIEMLKRQFHIAKEKNTKHGSHFYTLTHLMLFLRYLAEESNNSYDVGGFVMNYYKQHNLGRFAKVTFSNLKRKNKDHIDEEATLTKLLTDFIKYLSRRFISSTHTIDQLVSAYVQNEMVDVKHKMRVKHFAIYINGNDNGIVSSTLLEFINEFNKSKGSQRFIDRYTPQSFCDAVFNLISSNLIMKFDAPFKYDGAYVYVPEHGIETRFPISCVDYSGMYPSSGIENNVGFETIVTQSSIKKYHLKAGIDFEQINLYNRDDHNVVDITKLSEYDASRHFICFLKPKYINSVLSEQWQHALENRLFYKKQIGTFSDEKDNIRVKEMSDTYKIYANSIYGVLPYLGYWKVSAAITSKGRQNIQKVAYDIKRTHDGVTVYGDTDSVMFHLRLTTDQLCSLYTSGELINRGWIKKFSTSIDSYKGNTYKQGCMIAAEISKEIAENINRRHLDNPQQAIHFPPSKLEHEKVMLPFVIVGQKHYFARIMDDDGVDPKYILRGLECCKRTKLQATDDIENTMFRDLLQMQPNTWNTYRLSCNIVNSLVNDTYDLKKVCSRKKITCNSNRKEKPVSDAGFDLFNRMSHRGEITDTGGLDKISVNVVKVLNFENNKKVKLESLDYLTRLQKEGKTLHLDTKAIVKQLLGEVVSIMQAVHTKSTYAYFADLLRLKICDTVTKTNFDNFNKSQIESVRKNILKDVPADKSMSVKTLFNFFATASNSKLSCKRKNEDLNKDVTQTRLKQMKLQF